MANSKSWIIFLVLLVISLNEQVFSQQITVDISKRDVLSTTIRLHKIFGHDESNYYLIKFSGNQYFLEKLDNELNTVIEEPIKLFKGFKTYQLESVVDFYDDIYVFVSFKRINNSTLYYQKIDKTTLLPTSEVIELTTIKCVNGAWADFHFALSRSENKLMVFCRTKLVWTRAQFNEIYVFDEDLQLHWKRNDTYEFRGQGPRDNEYLVDEQGNVSILSLLKRESIFSLMSEIKNLYGIYRYTHEGNDFTEYPVSLPDKYIRGLKIIGGEHGELICAGLYSEIYKTGMRGTFFFKIDPATGHVFDHQMNEFDEAVLAELASIKEPLLKDEEVMNYVITDMILRENGKMILIAEQVFHQTFNTYNNLIITCYDVTGQVYWTRIVAKNQNFNYTSIAPTDVDLSDYRKYLRESGFFNQNINNYCSYALMAPLDATGIVIFYNDDIRNMDGTGERKDFNRPKKSYILAVSVDEFGNIKKTPLVPWRKKALYPEPLRYYDTLSNTIVIPAFRNRSIEFYKITADL